jgi:ABC-type transport system involved in cytochrome c biogenesis permease subunit
MNPILIAAMAVCWLIFIGILIAGQLDSKHSDAKWMLGALFFFLSVLLTIGAASQWQHSNQHVITNPVNQHE